MLRVAGFYLAFNLCLNFLLALTRPMNFSRIYELGHLDSRSEAALLLSRHYLWHSSWEDEQNLEALTVAAAKEGGVDLSLFRALIEAESGGRPHAVSDVGACGLTQLMPSTARWLGLHDPFDPRENLYGGARYLGQLHRRFRGNVALTLAAYNAGPGAVLKAGGVPPFRETRSYVARISQRYRVLAGRAR
jgi:soluble lytic murein transglycosylase-like protein